MDDHADDLALGLVGCGRLAEIGYVPAGAAVHGARLVAVADSDRGRRQHVATLAAQYGQQVTTHRSAAELLDAAVVDAVILATPVDAHLPDATLTAAAGLPSLVEKPPARDTDGAARLGALEPAPWIAFNRRFDPGNQEIRDKVRAQGPQQLDLEVCYRRRSWAPYTVADDALLDLGPHLVDLATWLLGIRIDGVVDAVVTSQRASAQLRAGDAVVRIACATDRPHRERVELRDADGQAVAHQRSGGMIQGLLARIPGRQVAHPLTTSMTRQLAAFVDAVRGGAGGELGTTADGLAVMQVVDAIRASARTRQPVTVPDTPEDRG